MTTDQPLEYRLAHLRERLATADTAELGVRAEVRGDTVLLTGTVPTTGCRDQILRIAEEELRDVPVRDDLVLADATAPDQSEELA